MPQIKHPPVIDVSHWINVDDFAVLAPLPWLVILKATDGTYYLDAEYAKDADTVRDAGIRLGAYHFMRSGDPTLQADWFCEIVLQVGLRGNEILICDMELDGISLADIKAFLDRVQSKTGVRPLIYTTQLRLESLYANRICPAWLKSEWLWIAEYPPNPDLTNEIPAWIVPAGLLKNNIALWQYTDDGIYPGIPGNNVDLNLINPLYAQAIGLTEPIPGGVIPMAQYYEVVSNVPSMNRVIRSSPIHTADQISRILAGTTAKASIDDVKTFPADVWSGGVMVAKKGDRWVHLFENNGASINGWCAEIHLGVRYTNLKIVGEVPEPTVKHTVDVYVDGVLKFHEDLS